MNDFTHRPHVDAEVAYRQEQCREAARPRRRLFAGGVGGPMEFRFLMRLARIAAGERQAEPTT